MQPLLLRCLHLKPGSLEDSFWLYDLRDVAFRVMFPDLPKPYTVTQKIIISVPRFDRDLNILSLYHTLFVHF